MPVLNVYKPAGSTPFEVIEQLRKERPEFKNTPVTYAGRLDPMAKGVLLLLTGADRHKKDLYLQLGKTYRATVLFGFTSDTYDALGLVRRGRAVKKDKIAAAVKNLAGVHELPFPVYSSFKVKNKPLHWWAREGRLGEIDVPVKRMEVLKVGNIEVRERNGGDVLRDIVRRVNLVSGDFRQQKIKKRWREFLPNRQSLKTVDFTLRVTSGTYVRSLAHKLGEDLGCGALLFNLVREKVGRHTVRDALHLAGWTGVGILAI